MLPLGLGQNMNSKINLHTFQSGKVYHIDGKVIKIITLINTCCSGWRRGICSTYHICVRRKRLRRDITLKSRCSCFMPAHDVFSPFTDLSVICFVLSIRIDENDILTQNSEIPCFNFLEIIRTIDACYVQRYILAVQCWPIS